jgi:hypothetical protein
MESVLVAPRINVRTDPFRYAEVRTPLDAELAAATLSWFEQSATWELVENQLFELHYCTNLIGILASEARAVISRSTRMLFLSAMERGFGAVLDASKVSVDCYKMTAGQQIRTHTDPPERSRGTHRFVIHLASEDMVGGHLEILEREDSVSALHTFGSTNNDAFAFELAGQTWHRVTPVQRGIRYSLLYYFDAVERPGGASTNVRANPILRPERHSARRRATRRSLELQSAPR